MVDVLKIKLLSEWNNFVTNGAGSKTLQSTAPPPRHLEGDTGGAPSLADPPALAFSTIWSPSLPTFGISPEARGSGDPSLPIVSNRLSLG